MLASGWVVPGCQDHVLPTRSADMAALVQPCQLDVRDGRCAVASGGVWLLGHALAMAGSNPAVPSKKIADVLW
jgi:hypothetical protein